MSVSQFPKSTTSSESNIPLPKRTNTGMKKSKRCAQLPELQKYFETIIKASNECDSEDTSQSDKDRFPKERKFGRYSVHKGLDSRPKQEKDKNQLYLTGSKNIIKAKTQNSDAVSRGVRVYNMFAPEFEDPRNWKHDKIQNLGPSVEIEKFLKKFYPNPYQLENVIEFRQSKNDKNESRDGTLPDVVISKANIHTEVDIGKRDNDLQTADNEPVRENKVASPTSETSLKIQSALHYEKKHVTEDKGCSLSVPALFNKSSVVHSTTSNTSSLASSPDSLPEMPYNYSLRKRKSVKPKSRSKPIKSDYDIGKLKLLNLSDSEPSTSKQEKLKITTRNIEKNSKLCEEIYKTDDFNDLKKIYDIMQKATDSFLYMNSKNESAVFSKSLMESQIFSNKLNQDTKIELDNSETIKLELSNSDTIENELYNTVGDKTVENEKQEPLDMSLIGVILKEEKLECNSNPENRKPESVHDEVETVSNRVESAMEGTSEEEKEFNNTSQKIDEVLDFMYDCLRKFNNEKSLTAERKKLMSEDKKPCEKTLCKRLRKETVVDINDEKPSTSVAKPNDIPWTSQDPTESLLAKTFPDIKDIQSKYTAALDEINRKASRTRCKRRPSFIGYESPSYHQIPVNETFSNTATQSLYNQEPVEENIENRSNLQIVESQNELGSFTEQLNQVLSVSDESRNQKCSLSVKRKKSKTITGKRLKDVLEAEENLLSGEQNGKEWEVQPKGAFIGATDSQTKVQNDIPKLYPNLDNLKHGNWRSATVLKPNLPIPAASSSTDFKKNNKPSKLYHKLQKMSIPSEVGCFVLQHSYRTRQAILLTVNKTFVLHTAWPVYLKKIINFSKSMGEDSFKKSECILTVMVMQQPFPKTQSTLTVRTAPEIGIDDDKPVEDLIVAIEETEEKLFLLEHNSAENLYSRYSEMCSLSTSETLKNDIFSEIEVEKGGDRKKVNELLLRTYNLQQKLHRYLQKMACPQPTSVSCPMVQQETVLDFNVGNKIRTEFRVKPESSLPIVHWHLKPLDETEIVTIADESVTVNVSMADHSTSYEPPEEEICEETNVPIQETKSGKDNDEQFGKELANEEDDRSSNYSFKSSNDYSEPNEEKLKKESKHTGYMDNQKFFQKIFNEIESFRQSFEAEKLEKQHQQMEQGPKEPEEQMDRRLSQYNQKVPAKVLRTVFTGKKSSTELTIGLKDVPMTKLGNISVEKTKLSPNHTKISVAFKKETPEETPKLSSYYFDHMRPSLSTCVTEYSESKDNDSSQSLNAHSEDDEEDYKSVGSTVANSDSDEEPKSQSKEQEIVESSLPKTNTKHRFEFYRKMNSDMESTNINPKSISDSVCKYKELEPLKQALTDMQIRMRNIKRDAIFSSNDYYERALKLAKMSAGFCQNCGNRAVIPNDTFGYYRTLLPRRSTHGRRSRHFRSTQSPNPSFYSLRSNNVEVSNRFCELGINHSSYVLHPKFQSNRTVLRSSLHDMPIFFEKM